MRSSLNRLVGKMRLVSDQRRSTLRSSEADGLRKEGKPLFQYLPKADTVGEMEFALGAPDRAEITGTLARIRINQSESS